MYRLLTVDCTYFIDAYALRKQPSAWKWFIRFHFECTHYVSPLRIKDCHLWKWIFICLSLILLEYLPKFTNLSLFHRARNFIGLLYHTLCICPSSFLECSTALFIFEKFVSGVEPVAFRHFCVYELCSWAL